MFELVVRVKLLHPDARLPAYAKDGDAGMDLYSLEDTYCTEHALTRIRTGIAVEIPRGFVGLCWDKSGLASFHSIKVMAGVIDSGYRGEMTVSIYNHANTPYVFKRGDKVMQMLIQPVVRVRILQAEELTQTARGSGGFGSTGK